MAVSVVPCWGRAVVLLVSMSPCFCVLCAIFFALLGLMRVRARKSSPCVLTMAKSGRLMARWASIFAEMRLKRLCRASLLCRVPGTGALLLAALTLQCAAKPYWWHGGQPAQATTYRVNVRINGPRCPPAGFRPPPIELTRGSSGPRAQDTFTETEEGHTARRPPDALYMPRETTEAGPRRIPPLVARGDRTVGAEKSRS